jgi:CubicO group peptidase (beta-lactamase class C family)
MEPRDRVIGDAVEAVFARSTGLSLALLVMVDGRTVIERYGVQPASDLGPEREITPETTLISWSIAKSITHALVGLMVGDGLLDPDAPAPVPEWAGTPKAAIRLIDLLEMRSGLRFLEEYTIGQPSDCIDMLWGSGKDDHAAYAAALPLDHEPATVWSYSSGTTNIICRIIGGVLCGDPDAPADSRRRVVSEYLQDRLLAPAGMTDTEAKFDTAGNLAGSSFVFATARDYAAFGEVYRRDGLGPDGRRILPEGWAEHGRTFVAHDPEGAGPAGFDYGRHWWMWPHFPGSMAAHGFMGQFTLVVPDRGVTLVHLGVTERDHSPELVTALGAVVEAAAPAR